ncbi:MAG: FtsQ-type POTRA domain-containing protein [Desulfamplus sp.]|nr:FtsQ-type POTRA domain-containing protein [Desulfamplus sp.]
MNKKRKENRYRPPTGSSPLPSIDFMGPLEVGLKVIFLVIALTAATLFFIFVENAATQATIFSLSDISVSGNVLITSDEIIEKAGIRKGDNILDINLQHVRFRLISHPWIQDAAVKRIMPSDIAITVREQKPLALVRVQDTADILMNVKGEPFSENDGIGADTYQRLPREDNPGVMDCPDPLPIVKGLKLHLDDNGKYLFAGRLHESVMEILHMEKEELDIETIYVDMETGMKIKGKIGQVPDESLFQHGNNFEEPVVTITLGFDNLKEKLKKIRHIVKYMQENSPDKKICSIDLINPENIVIKTIKGEGLMEILQGGV